MNAIQQAQQEIEKWLTRATEARDGDGQVLTPATVKIYAELGAATEQHYPTINNRIGGFEKAIEAVLKLHEPFDLTADYATESLTCLGCHDPENNHWPSYPCPTVTAIQTALGGDEG